MNADLTNLPSSIAEFFTPGEFAEMPEYERMHLSRMRQNYEALKRYDLKPQPPEFMLKKTKKGIRDYMSPTRNRMTRRDSSSDDSDEDWTPGCERRKEACVTPFVPVFQSQRKRKYNDNPVRNPKKKIVTSKAWHKNKKTSKKDLSIQLDYRCPSRDGEFTLERKIDFTANVPADCLQRCTKAKTPTHYVLRKRPLMKYMSLAVPDEDDFLYCEDCNMEYPSDCPVHGPLTVVEDREVPVDVKKSENPKYCLYTLPDGLVVNQSKIPNAGDGVFATKHFPARTRFGPYKGTKEKNEDMAHDSGYCWQIYQNGKPSHFVDAKDPKNSNWMRYVNCARSEEEQCLTAYQHEGEIYYRAHRNIKPGDELLVYYGDNYAEDLGIKMQVVGHCRREKKQEQSDTGTYPCHKCHLAFSTHLFLERHIQRLHNEEYWRIRREHSCGSSIQGVTVGKKCDNNDSSVRSNINSHMQIGRANTFCETVNRDKPYKCTVCDKAFSERGSLTSHMRTHTGDKPYKCTVCDKAFSQSSDLTRHMRTHTGEKPYKCTVCDKAFSRSTHLTSHMRTHTGDKPYKCTVCDKAFSVSSHLTSHMRTHTGDKPYKCTVCDKAFSESSNLTSHMRTHTGDKPYKCTVCDKAFSVSSHLTSHMRTHTGDKPYKCTVCDKAFSESSNLTKHMRTHTGDKPYTS